MQTFRHHRISWNYSSTSKTVNGSCRHLRMILLNQNTVNFRQQIHNHNSVMVVFPVISIEFRTEPFQLDNLPKVLIEQKTSPIMEIPIEIITNQAERVSKKLFSDNTNKDITLDRARIKFQKQTISLESPEVKISLKVIILTPFGAASVANFIFERLRDIQYTKIKIGDKVQRISQDRIRESILQQYSKQNNLIFKKE